MENSFFGNCIRSIICFSTSLRIRSWSAETQLVIGAMPTSQRSEQLLPNAQRCSTTICKNPSSRSTGSRIRALERAVANGPCVRQ